MKIYFSVLLVFLLVACNPQQPQTHFEEIISTPTPTSTITPSFTPTTTITAVPVADNGLLLDAKTIIALEAANKAAAAIPGPYSWEEFRHCSSYASEYMRQLGYPVNGPFSPEPDHDNAFPWTSVVKQVAWLRANFPDKVNDAPLIDFLNGNLYDKILPGSLVYLQTAINHNGFNTYYHVVILIGYHTDGSPQFAELARDMDNAATNRSFYEMTSFYHFDKGWNVEPILLVTWFDPIP